MPPFHLSEEPVSGLSGTGIFPTKPFNKDRSPGLPFADDNIKRIWVPFYLGSHQGTHIYMQKKRKILGSSRVMEAIKSLKAYESNVFFQLLGIYHVPGTIISLNLTPERQVSLSLF